MTITEFLNARYDEDEQVARAATPGHWGPSGHSVLTSDDIEFIEASRTDSVHIARHDPARALREITAKRALLRAHPFEPYADEPSEGFCAECQRGGSAGVWPCPTVRIMSAVYADHPDYRQEWKPQLGGIDGTVIMR